MKGDTEKTERLLRLADEGDAKAIEDLFRRHRERLVRMVRLRMDRRLHGRIDASDVIQDAYVVAWRRLPAYLKKRDMPFFLWLRFLAGEKLIELHRRHLGAQKRDVGREVRLHHGPLPEATSAALAHQLLGRQTAPSQAAARAEAKIQLQEALNAMDDMDREVLALRHFEALTNVEAAQILGVTEAAATKRYVRALRRLRKVMRVLPEYAEPNGE